MFGLYKELERLEVSNDIIKIAHVGAGVMGTNFIGQAEMAPGMEVSVIVDIDINRGIEAFKQSGINDNKIIVSNKINEIRKALKDKKRVCSSNFEEVVALDEINVVVEATGKVAAGAKIAFDTIKHKKHIVSFGVEMDVVVGHILKMMADSAGVVYTGIYGDEPGIIKLLFDQARALGFEIVAAGRGDLGNSDLKWNHETVKALIEARHTRYKSRGSDSSKLKINPYLFGSFRDGSKMNEELTMVANATGLVPDVRGAHNPSVSFTEWTEKVPKLFDLKKNGGLLNQYGVVEAVQVPEGEGPVWCFIVVTSKLDSVISGLRYHSSGGPGPNWVWYEPIHWISAQAPISVALAVLHNQATIAPLDGKRVADTIAIAKKDLAIGEEIDEFGGFCVAGRIEKAKIAKEKKLLPYGLAKGSILIKEVEKGKAISYEDVKIPYHGNFALHLRQLQDQMFDV